MELVKGNGNGGSSASAGEPPSPVERVRVAGDVLVERAGSIVMRADVPYGRRLVVLADPRMSAGKVAAELHELARRLERAPGSEAA